ncbi:MAG: LCP family protein [Chloroflexota bacterium]
MDPRPAPGRQRSAFAAAAFSLLFPGLGQAYLGRWARALAWAALPVLVVALVAGIVVSSSARTKALEGFLTSDALGPFLLLLGIDLVYRLACVLDAWRLGLATQPRRPTGLAASVAGLAVVLGVLALSHVAAARPVQSFLSTAAAIEGDDDPQETFDPSLLASFRPHTPPPDASLAPGQTPEPADSAAPTPSQGPGWDEGGRLSILLVGSDGGRPGGGHLTDTLMVVTVDTRTKQVAMISIPRDMQDIPLPRSWPAYKAYGGEYSDPINTLYTAARINPNLFAPGADDFRKGYEALKGVLGNLYGITIDYYVSVDLSSFRKIVDALGGAMIDVQNPVYDRAYPADDGRLGHLKLYIPPGLQYMNGTQALAYARARHLTSDFDRAARQQRVVTSIREQVDLSTLLDPTVLNGLLDTIKSSIRTDIPVAKLPKLIQLAQGIDLDKRISLVLSPPAFGTECYLTSDCPNDYRLVANVPAIEKAVRNIFSSDRDAAKLRQKLTAEDAGVEVLNGTGDPNLKTTRIAEVLSDAGYDAAVPPVNEGAADRSDYTSTVVIAWNGAQDRVPIAGQALAKAFGVKLEARDDPDATADYTVIVGADTEAPG